MGIDTLQALLMDQDAFKAANLFPLGTIEFDGTAKKNQDTVFISLIDADWSRDGHTRSLLKHYRDPGKKKFWRTHLFHRFTDSLVDTLTTGDHRIPEPRWLPADVTCIALSRDGERLYWCRPASRSGSDRLAIAFDRSVRTYRIAKR